MAHTRPRHLGCRCPALAKCLRHIDRLPTFTSAAVKPPHQQIILRHDSQPSTAPRSRQKTLMDPRGFQLHSQWAAHGIVAQPPQCCWVSAAQCCDTVSAKLIHPNHRHPVRCARIRNPTRSGHEPFAERIRAMAPRSNIRSPSISSEGTRQPVKICQIPRVHAKDFVKNACIDHFQRHL